MRTIAIRMILTAFAGVLIAVGAGMASASAATARHYPVVVTNWHGAFTHYLTHQKYCDIAPTPPPADSRPHFMACTTAPFPPGHDTQIFVNFRSAMRWLFAGAAITRVHPHLWLVVARFFD